MTHQEEVELLKQRTSELVHIFLVALHERPDFSPAERRKQVRNVRKLISEQLGLYADNVFLGQLITPMERQQRMKLLLQWNGAEAPSGPSADVLQFPTQEQPQ